MQSPTINGVKISRHSLTIEAGRLNALARQVGIRLRQWFREYEVGLPDTETLPYFKWYSDAVLGLLKEHRARAALKPDKGGMPLTDAEFERALLAELAEIEKRKGAIDVPGSAVVMPANGAAKSEAHGDSPVDDEAADSKRASPGSTPGGGPDLFDFGEGGEE